MVCGGGLVRIDKLKMFGGWVKWLEECRNKAPVLRLGCEVAISISISFRSGCFFNQTKLIIDISF